MPPPADLVIRRAAERDLDAINAIYNREVREGVATWELDEWPAARRREWFREHDDASPVFVAESGGAVVGFAYLSTYRGRRGYQYTRENTVMVDPAYHRMGIGRLLLGRAVEAGRALGLRTIVAWITSSNVASVELHRSLGYTVVGEEVETGRKFGAWHSAVEMQLLLGRPEVP